jgi:hypothetical protein
MAAGPGAYARTTFLSTQSVRAWLDPNVPKGQLAQALCVHLTEIKAGFQAHEINDKAMGDSSFR